MKANELREKSVKELKEEITALLREKFNLGMQRAMGNPARSHLFQNVRRKIARIKTILREKAGQ